MNFRLITQTMGYILWVEAGFLLLPALTACVCGEVYWRQFLLTAALCAAVGTGLRLIPVKKAQMHSRDGFIAVALSWVLLSLFGALPYVFTGAMTSYIDALFETVSGLTTTGSSTFTAVSHLPRSVLLWRSLTQWMGGMGVLVLFLALTPRMGEGAVFLMRAESPGPIKSKLVPKVGGTAKILYTIYVILTACEVVALRIAGESWFSAINHSFTTMATGGFSIYDTSLAGASKAVMWIVTVFSFLAGVNFSLMFLAVRGKLKEVLRSEELRIYVGIVAAATLLLCINLRVQAGIPFGDSITDAAFQTVTIMTTTGFATVDFSLWPTFCRMALVMLMFIGACAGSTSGGIKISRVAILCKSLKRELKRLAHPHHVSVLKVDGQAVEERGRLLRRRVHRGIPAGAAGGRTGGQLGQLRLSGVLRRLSDLHQQRGARPRYSGAYGEFLHPLAAEQAGAVAGDAYGTSGADAPAGAAAAQHMAGLIRTKSTPMGGAFPYLCRVSAPRRHRPRTSPAASPSASPRPPRSMGSPAPPCPAPAHSTGWNTRRCAARRCPCPRRSDSGILRWSRCIRTPG